MSLAISVDMKEAEKYGAIIKVAGERFLPEIDKAAHITVNEGKRYVIEKTPKITGNLRRGFQVQRLAPAVWMIFNLIKYATWIEKGKRQDKNGNWVFMGKQIGGYKMVERSIQQITDRLSLNISVALDKLMYWRK